MYESSAAAAAQPPSSSTTASEHKQTTQSRIVFVCVSLSTASPLSSTPPPSSSFDLPPDNEYSIWWPAFLYKNHKSLSQSLKDPLKKRKAARETLDRIKAKTNTKTLALLLGDKTPMDRVSTSVISTEYTRDFFDFFEEAYTEAMEGKRHQGFIEACDDAMERMNSVEGEGEVPVILGTPTTLEKSTAIVPYVQNNQPPKSTTETSSAGPTPAAPKQHRRQKLSHSATTVVSSDSPSKPLSKPPPLDSDSDSNSTPNKKSAVMDLEAAGNQSPASPASPPPKKQKTNQAILTWGPKNKNLSPLSADPATPLQETNVILPNDIWGTVYDKLMKVMGWSYRNGHGLVSFFFIHPSHKNTPTPKLLKECKEHVDYVTSDNDLMKYCRDHYGWEGIGDMTSPASTAKSDGNSNIHERVKKRRLRKRGKKREAIEKLASVQEEVDDAGSTNSVHTPPCATLEEVSQPRDSMDSDLTPSVMTQDHEDEHDEEEDEEDDEVEEDNLTEDNSTTRSQRSSSSLEEESVDTRESISARRKKYNRQSSSNKAPHRSDSKPPLHPNPKKRKLDMDTPSALKSSKGRKRKSTPKAEAMQKKTQKQKTKTPTPPATPDVSCSSENRQIRLSIEIWRLLMSHFSFSFVDGKYCFPFVKPKTTNAEGKEFKEGVDYFCNLIDLRRHLCAYGLPEPKPYVKLTEKEIFDLSAWIRYANVVSFRKEPAEVPAYAFTEFMTGSQWWHLATRLGFRYKGGKYVFPKVSLQRKGVLKDGRDYFESRNLFEKHLARFGLPNYVEGLNTGIEGKILKEEERLAFDLYLAGCPYVGSVFKRQEPPYVEIVDGLFSHEHEQASLFSSPSAGPPPSNGANSSAEQCASEEDNNQRLNQPEKEGQIINNDKSTSSAESTSNQEEPDSPPENMIVENLDNSNVAEEEEDSSGSTVDLIKDTDSSDAADGKEQNATSDDVVSMKKKVPGIEHSKEIDRDFANDSMHNEIDDGSSQEGSAVVLMTQPCHDPQMSCDISSPDLLDNQQFSIGSNLDGLLDASSCAEGSQKQPVEENVIDCSPLTPKTPLNASEDIPQGNDDRYASPKILHAIQCNNKLDGVPVKGPNGVDIIGTPVQKDDAWVNVIEKMKYSGWKWQKGDGLVDYFFVLPGGTVKNGVKGEDYLTSEFEMKKFAYEKLQWGGDENFREEYKASKEAPEKGRRSRRHHQPLPPLPEEVVFSKEKVDDRTPSTKPKSAHGVTAQVSKKEKEEKPVVKVPLPDKEFTIGEKLKRCLQVLHPSYNTNTISHGTRNSSHLSPAVAEVKEFLKNVIRSWGAQGGIRISDDDNHDQKRNDNGASLYVCGGPGTGKTSTVQRLCQEMSQWSIEHRHDLLTNKKSIKKWEIVPSFCFVNVAHIQNSTMADSKGASNEILRRIAESLNLKADAQEQDIEKHLDSSGPFNKRVLVLVLDEVDLLLPNGARASVGEALLRRLMAWSANPSYLFGLIGISNSVDDARARSLSHLGIASKTVVFSAYREEDLIAILKDRVGSKIVDPAALQFVARKVAASSGDARLALELASNAVSKALYSLSDEKLNSEMMEGPLVKMPHMMRAVGEGTGLKHTELIKGLPLAAKVVLCVAMALSQVSPQWKVISLASLKKYCAEATKHGLVDNLTTDQIYELVGQLTDAGLLMTGDNNPGEEMNHHVYHNPYEIPLSIGVQLDEVEFAMDSTLNQHPFYSKMMDYVRRTNINNR